MTHDQEETMKIVTVIRHVPDAEARVRVEDGEVALSGATFVLDGMDEYGVEQALRLRDDGVDAEIVAVAVGPERSEEALRTALAMGADRARLLETDAPLDPLATASALARLIAEEEAGLVFVGGKQADWDSAALGPAMAEALGWPLSDWTTAMAIEDGRLEVQHDADAGSETLSLPLPAVVSTQQGLNEPRYPTLPNIMKAKRKELRREPAEAETPRVRTSGRALEQRERLGRVLDGDPAEAAAEVARYLQEAGR
jgi:electron transfer flavoprotein beta subunit